MTDRNKAKITAAKVAAQGARDQAREHAENAAALYRQMGNVWDLTMPAESADYIHSKVQQQEATFRAELEEGWAAHLEGKR